ncbi:MAG: alpha/beta hydrolase [Eubacteriaceae bacterium]|nr:alpha/beta hydrolase [Eubacteriaceae bacterium]
MKKEILKIENIPVLIWGEKSYNLYIFVHGKMSNKDEALGFAKIAEQKGFQVLSFDLPEHGERKDEKYPCMVWNAVHDLGIISDYAQRHWKCVNLFGCSLGAYFSLLAYKDLPLIKCLFLSPILDMERLIQNMMKWSNISEQDLRENQTMPTPMGVTLYWDYYCYVKENPIDKWDVPTAILYGSEDDMTEREVVEWFTKRFDCDLAVLENSGHWFHTERQIASLEKWLYGHI